MPRSVLARRHGHGVVAVKRASLATLALIPLLAGCGGPGGADDTSPNGGVTDANLGEMENGDLYERTVRMSDGRQVVCLVYFGYRKGGVSCDWDHATRP